MMRAFVVSLLLGAVACGEATDATASPVPGRVAPLRAATAPRTTDGMLAIPAGRFVPLYVEGDGAAAGVAVAPFFLDRTPVTNAQFLEFVEAQPRWRRSQADRLFADDRYLAHWAGDLDLGPHAAGAAPVTFVSWFAARAYAAWRGKRLPSVAEWEYVAAAGESGPRGSEEPGFHERILAWYGRPTPKSMPPVASTFANVYGVWDMHGLIWEWVVDFNTAMVTGESRGDSGLERNLFCGAGALGAADVSDYAAFMRYAFRSSLRANYVIGNLGFRCAADGEDK